MNTGPPPPVQQPGAGPAAAAAAAAAVVAAAAVPPPVVQMGKPRRDPEAEERRREQAREGMRRLRERRRAEEIARAGTGVVGLDGNPRTADELAMGDPTEVPLHDVAAIPTVKRARAGFTIRRVLPETDVQTLETIPLFKDIRTNEDLAMSFMGLFGRSDYPPDAGRKPCMPLNLVLRLLEDPDTRDRLLPILRRLDTESMVMPLLAIYDTTDVGVGAGAPGLVGLVGESARKKKRATLEEVPARIEMIEQQQSDIMQTLAEVTSIVHTLRVQLLGIEHREVRTGNFKMAGFTLAPVGMGTGVMPSGIEDAGVLPAAVHRSLQTLGEFLPYGDDPTVEYQKQQWKTIRLIKIEVIESIFLSEMHTHSVKDLSPERRAQLAQLQVDIIRVGHLNKESRRKGDQPQILSDFDVETNNYADADVLREVMAHDKGGWSEFTAGYSLQKLSSRHLSLAMSGNRFRTNLSTDDTVKQTVLRFKKYWAENVSREFDASFKVLEATILPADAESKATAFSAFNKQVVTRECWRLSEKYKISPVEVRHLLCHHGENKRSNMTKSGKRKYDD